MRKFFSLVVASILATTSLFAAEVTVTKTIAQVQAYNNWETQYVDDKGFWHRTLNLDENIQLAALPESPESTSTQNGILYLNTTTSAPSDWRIYQARGGFQIIAKEGCVLKSATFEFGNKNNGCLVYGGKNYTTGQTITFDGTKALEEIAVGSTSGKTNGQARITSFTVVYEKKETPTPATKTIYCKMEQSWWKADNAAVGCHYWGTPGPGTTWPGVRMTPVEGETDLWSIDLDLEKVQNVIFTRVSPLGTSFSDWGAKTKDLQIPTDDKNLFTITTSKAVWGDPGCEGEWSVYGGAVEKPKHDYTITVYLPAFCDDIAAYADSVRVMGGFDDWSNGIWMEEKIDEDFNEYWYAEIKDVEEDTEFKLRFGTDADWKVQVQLNGANMANEAFGETTDIVLHYDGEGYGFAACAAPAARKEFVFVAGEAADSDPAMFAITWGKDGSSETVKMEKQKEALYAADILATVDSVVLVRCATGATEIIWDGEGKNIWNQTANYALCDTMYFESWVPGTNLFAVTCEAPKPVATKYYAKNNWNGGEWSWKEMSATNKENIYMLDSVVFGGTGININKKADDADAKWFDIDHINAVLYDGGGDGFWDRMRMDTVFPLPLRVAAVEEPEPLKLQAGDTIMLFFNIADTTLQAGIYGRLAPAARKEFVFVAGEAAEANPAMFAITWGKDGSNETVKMTQKGEEALYTANILETVDSVVLVRCASDATEIIWDGEGKNVWNQTANYELCDTMSFVTWVEDTNLFTITCEAPKPVETKYYAKNNWDGGEWSWLEMTRDTVKETLYTLGKVVFGGTGININTKEEDTDAFWFDADSIPVVLADTYCTVTKVHPVFPFSPSRAVAEEEPMTYKLLAGDTIKLFFNAADTTIQAGLLGRPAPAARKEFVFVAGEAAEANPAMFAITWGKDGSNETVKMTQKGEEALYTANILETVDSVVLVRCASDATEIIWDGEGMNVWNQTANYELCDTMSFVTWVEDTNLFTITCEAPKPVETKYYAKNNWDGGEWSWLEMTRDTVKETLYTLGKVVFGGTGININTKEEDTDAFWFDADSIPVVLADTYCTVTKVHPVFPFSPSRAAAEEPMTYKLLAGDTIKLFFNAADTTIQAGLLGRPAPAVRKEFVFVAGEAAEANPAMFAITWGKDGSNETVKMTQKGEEALYTANILETVDSVVLVRCASDATEIIWDGEGMNVWNQTANYELCDTMSFVTWVEDTNLFTITCDTPKPVETKYYAKNNWDGGEWSWLEMSATNKENIYMLDSVVFGGTGVNINDKADDADALYFAADAITVLDGLDGLPGPIPPEPQRRDTIPYAPAHSGVVLETPQLLAGDTIKLFFNAADSTLKAAIVGRPEQPQPAEVKYYVTGNAALVGEDKAWNAQAIEMIDSTYTFTELAAGEYEMKITNGAWDPEGQSWGSAALSEDCSAGVGDKNGNIHFVVETPNDVTVSIANGSVTVTGTFKEEPVETGITVNVTVPEGTPACFFYGEMSGNTFVEMTKVDDTHYTKEFPNATTIGWGYLFAWEKDNWNTKNAEGDFKVEPVNGVINVEVKAWVTAPGTEYKYTTYTEWQVKYGPAWEWVNTTKQEDGTFTVEAVWGNTGINIASGENPIKQDWYPLDDAALTVAEDVVEGDNVVITLTVVDDETVALNVKKGQEPATPDFGLLVNGTDYLPGTPEDKDTYTEYAVSATLAIGEFVQLYDNVNQAAWTVTPEGSGFTDFDIHDDAYYIKQTGLYQFYIKIPKEGMESGLYVGFQGTGTNLNKVKAAQGQRFNILGLPVDANYRGVVIMNGQTYLQ